MTISTLIVKNSYNGDGTTTQFAYTFPIHSTAEIKVIERSATGVETIKSLGTHYSITDTGNGGSVNFTTAPASGVEVVLIRDTNLTQEVDYIANDPFPAETHEGAIDKLTLLAQEQQEELDRTLKLSRTNSITSSEITEDATQRANKVLSFDPSGEILLDQELGTFRGNWAASTSYAARDLVKDTSTGNVFFVNTAHTSSGSQPLTTNANSAKYTLLVDAASATASQSAAAASQAAAAASATAAATSEAAANTANTNAQTALTQANAALSAAQTAQAAAEGSFDQFDDIYLGSKSSDPSTDNDGDPLTQGDLYHNSSSNTLRIFNNGAFQDVAVSTTGFAQAGFSIAMSVAL
jgi:hypothetical protein